MYSIRRLTSNARQTVHFWTIIVTIPTQFFFQCYFKSMSHILSHDTIYLLLLSEHANIHDTRLSIYVVTIAINIIYISIVMQKQYFIL